MKSWQRLLFALPLMAMTATAQTVVPSPVPLPTFSIQPSYVSSTSQVDENGNLLVFDMQYSVTSLLSGRLGLPLLFNMRLTVIPANGGAPVSKEYPATTFQFAGVGRWATYAIMTTYTLDQMRTSTTRRLIAINAGPAGTSLPDKAADFAFAELSLRVPQVQVSKSNDSSPDTIYAVDGPNLPLAMLPGPTTTVPATAVARTARIYKFGADRKFTSTQVNVP
jgi:hypothetical protein